MNTIQGIENKYFGSQSVCCQFLISQQILGGKILKKYLYLLLLLRKRYDALTPQNIFYTFQKLGGWFGFCRNGLFIRQLGYTHSLRQIKV